MAWFVVKHNKSVGLTKGKDYENEGQNIKNQYTRVSELDYIRCV